MTSFLPALIRFTGERKAWVILLASALLLDGCALFFQHGLDLKPCVNCVYERVAMFGIAFAGIIGLIGPMNRFFRWCGLTVWAYSAWRGLEVAREHVLMEHNPLLATCGFDPQFPAHLPLNHWFPAIFQPTGLCDDVQWRFLSLSMAEWLVWIFIAYLVVFALVVIIRLTPANNYDL